MPTTHVTDDSFDKEVRQSELPVIVDFWAEWCGPCKQIGPALEELSDEYAKIESGPRMEGMQMVTTFVPK